ncbi:MAG: Ig-like domain-containing protein [Thermoleophilia bacterium]
MRSLRPAVILAAAAALVAVLLTAGCGGVGEAVTTGDLGGRLEIAETYHDFGSVPVGEKVEYQFQLKNSGTGPLNLGQMEIKRLEGC